MNHWIVYPVLIPLLGGLLIPLLAGKNVALQRGVSLTAMLATLVVTWSMVFATAGGDIFVYQLGNWPAPFGIVLVVDRLSALMVALTSVIGLFSLIHAMQGSDTEGPYFHFLFQMQIVGIVGAFLTGDLFNLFVFFEILLLASYCLLVYGGGKRRIRAGVHYVVLNLVGSALFLVGVGTLYGVTGTLNMAHMAVRVAELGPQDAVLVQAGGLILMVVFALKAAMLPLYLWLPNVYSSAIAPVAALFSILTKVGVYSILRTSTLIFGPDAGVGANLIEPYLVPFALITLALGMIGAMGSRRMRKALGYMIIASLGTMLAAMGLFSVESIAAGLYYLVHSTAIMAAMFLLVDLIARQRGPVEDELNPGYQLQQTSLLGIFFFAAVIAAVGLPPLSGFLGKLLILQAAIGQGWGVWIWVVVLSTSFIALIALSRAGTMLFWKTEPAPEGTTIPKATWPELLPILGLLGFLVFWTGAAGALPEGIGLPGFTELTNLAAQQLLNPNDYIEAVLGR